MNIERISACTYPLREQPFDYALEVLADSGVRKADLWGRSPHFPEDCDSAIVAQIEAASARTGVAIANLGTYPGRAFSSDDEAERTAELDSMRRTIDAAAHLGCRSIRVMPGCYITGQACGMAASMAVEQATDPRGLNVGQLRRRLIDFGAYLP